MLDQREVELDYSVSQASSSLVPLAPALKITDFLGTSETVLTVAKWRMNILDVALLVVLEPFHSWNTQDLLRGFPGGSDGKASVCNAGDLGSISGLGPRKGRRSLDRKAEGARSSGAATRSAR